MNTRNPYKGLFPYTAQDEKFFFGRDKEAFDLVEMIKSNQLVILYGESGTGKTSLINAKLFPELKRQYYFPIYIRINYTHSSTPLQQLRQNIYSELKKWDSDVSEFTDDLTLIEYAAKTSIYNGVVNPILFFDQFEELFTLGMKYKKESDELKEFVRQVGDLIEMRLPKREMATVASDEYGENDIMEEARNKQLESTCLENALRFTVVFSLRQDFIAQLDDLRFNIPSISTHNRYRLKRFGYKQAFSAIVNPAKEYSEDLVGKDSGVQPVINDETANAVINQLYNLETGKPNNDAELQTTPRNFFRQFWETLVEFYKKHSLRKKDKEPVPSYLLLPPSNNTEIDPTILSLYCYQLFEESKQLTTIEEKEAGLSKITPTQVFDSPCDEIIKKYYNASLEKKKLRIAIERWLITPDGRKVLMRLEDFVTRSGLTEKTVEELKEKTAIVRIYSKGNDRQVELAHDRIARMALASKKEREANTIKRNAATISLSAIAIVTLGIMFIIYYVNQTVTRKQNEVNIQFLQKQNDRLKLQLTQSMEQTGQWVDTFNTLEENYNYILATRNTLLTDKDEINKQFNLIRAQLSSEINKNKYLTGRLSEANQSITDWGSRYGIRGDSLTTYIARARTLENDLDDIRSQLTRVQNEWSRRYTLKSDSLKTSQSTVSEMDQRLTIQLIELRGLRIENQRLKKDLDYYKKSDIHYDTTGKLPQQQKKIEND